MYRDNDDKEENRQEDEFRVQGRLMVDFIADYYAELAGEEAVIPHVEPGFMSSSMAKEAPEHPVDFEEVLTQVRTSIYPGMTHWHHPRFFGFYPTGSSFPSLLGSMLTDCFGCIGLNWVASPSCTELEMVVLDWLVRAMALPSKFMSIAPTDATHMGCGGGSILASASDCSLMVLLVAREQALSHLAPDSCKSRCAVVDSMVVYFTKQAHSSVERACKIALLPHRWVGTDGQFRMDPLDLEQKINEDKAVHKIPLMVVTSMGSTSLCVFDDLDKIGDVCLKTGLKCHVDAAYAGSALLCPEFRHLAKGVEKMSSFCFNPHKLMRTHFNCSVLWTDERESARRHLSVDAAYLQHDFEDLVSDLRHWQIPLGRKFHSLKLWFVLQMFGLEGLRQGIRKHAALAKVIEKRIQTIEQFEIVGHVEFGLVCFRFKDDSNNEKTRSLYEAMKKDHSFFLSSSFLEEPDLFFLRMVCGRAATEKDLHQVLDCIERLL